MTQPAEAVFEIYLNPGELHFGDRRTRIHTTLGSCVSISLWHPVLRIGGMCHFVQPQRGKAHNDKLDGRYADEAFELLLHEIGKRDTRPDEYQAKLFGGGNMFSQTIAGEAFNVARSNIEAARTLLKAGGFVVHAEHVGGGGHRHVIFDVSDGIVWVRHEETAIAPGRDKLLCVKPAFNR